MNCQNRENKRRKGIHTKRLENWYKFSNEVSPHVISRPRRDLLMGVTPTVVLVAELEKTMRRWLRRRALEKMGLSYA
jgi:hypothetical protein